MIKLPRLTQLVQLVDPKTGLPTLRGSDFWNQAMTNIESNVTAVQAAETAIAAQLATITKILGGETDVALLTDANTWTAQQTFDEPLEAPAYLVDGVPIGGAVEWHDGTIDLGASDEVFAGTNITLTGGPTGITISATEAAGINAVDARNGIEGSIVGDTLSLSGTGLEFIEGTTVITGVLEVVAGAGMTIAGTSGGPVTLSAAASGGGITAVNTTNGITGSISGGTLDLSGTLLELIEGTTTLTGILGIVAGSNVTIGGTSGGLGTISSTASIGSGGITEFIQGTLTATGAATLGSGLSLSGTTNPTLSNTGLIEFLNGTTAISGAITVGSGITFSGNTISAAASVGSAGLIITDGPTAVANPSILNISGAGTTLTASGIPPSIVQSASGSSVSSVAVSLPANPTIGNLLVCFTQQGTAAAGFTQLGTLQNNGYAGASVFFKVCTTPATDKTITVTHSADAVTGLFFEIASAGTLAIQGGASSGPSPTAASITPTVLSLVLSHFAFNTGTGGTPSAPLPSGAIIEKSINDVNNALSCVVGSAGAGAPIIAGVTAPSGSGGVAYNQLVISPLASKVAADLAIETSTPVTINGTAAGNFQSLVITTGNSITSVSLSGSALTINLGTP